MLPGVFMYRNATVAVSIESFPMPKNQEGYRIFRIALFDIQTVLVMRLHRSCGSVTYIRKHTIITKDN